jgi:hypothetical protein
MDLPATFFAAQALLATLSAPAVDPQAQQNAIKFAVSSIEYVCLDAKNPDLCGEEHWLKHTGRELVDLVDDTKRRRRAGHPGPREVAICQPPYKMTAREGCQ